MAEQIRWIVNDNSGHGCEDITIYMTMEEANAYALARWNSLFPKEKEYYVITVHYITEEMLEDYAADKGEINWYLYKTCAQTPECFDSNEYKKTHP